ncbi:MAG: protein-glutamate O-methyltransferase CheR [Archangium sp.]|nr:protein-glutamate O-methyltransferase CheR [Archangium sp.]
MAQPDDDELEALEVRLFLEAVHERYGYDLREYSSASMIRRVHAALIRSGAPNLAALQHRVLREPGLFASVLDDLTVRVSEMFRDPEFFLAFRKQVVPVLHTYPVLKIWLSGCASGEEVYSTAIILMEEGLYERTQLYATDLSPQALEQAKQGLYSAQQLPAFNTNYLQSGGQFNFTRYCTAAYDGVAMHEALRRNVLFFQHNLVSDHVFGEMHVVFCRNVLIYFEPELRQRVMGTFRQSLCPGGFLALGRSERVQPSPGFSAFVGDQRIFRLERQEGAK